MGNSAAASLLFFQFSRSKPAWMPSRSKPTFFTAAGSGDASVPSAAMHAPSVKGHTSTPCALIRARLTKRHEVVQSSEQEEGMRNEHHTARRGRGEMRMEEVSTNTARKSNISATRVCCATHRPTVRALASLS